MMAYAASVVVLITLFAPLSPDARPSRDGVPDTPFAQEYHERFPIVETGAENDVRAVAVDPSGRVWAATAAGVFFLLEGKTAWKPLSDTLGPAFDVTVDASGTVWLATWDGLYRFAAELRKESTVEGPVSAVCTTPSGMAAMGPTGLWRLEDGKWTRTTLPCSRNIRDMIPDGAGGLWIATGMGLYHHTADGDTLYQNAEEILSSDVCGVACAPDGTLWAADLGGITVYRDGVRIDQATPEKGLPSAEVQCVSRAPDGRMWVGTTQGVTRYNGSTWSLRHSRRWLLDDDVRDVAFGADGSAWIATAGGISAVKQRRMTLAEKAAHFDAVCHQRHVRAPWIVEKCRLPVPGDTHRWLPEDDDNDGGYTAVYMVAECCRYAVTKAPDAKENAKKAFDLLELLQTITETSGLVARTIVPSTWPEQPTQMHDRNQACTEQERAAQLVDDPRYKPVEVRWRPSKDGKWLWKGDTSSDEITAHFFGYLFYYDLAADAAEKERTADLARRIMDYIIDHGYVLADIDGAHTRWGVWSPEKLNGDPDWRAERGINSLEILSFLKATYHMTGDEKYQREYLALLHEHGYGENARHAKTYAPAWRTHIDTELLCMAYPALLLYEEDPELRVLWRESLDYWFKDSELEQSPYFNFTYGLLTGQDPRLEDSIFFLRDAPLDLVRWTVDNSKREDLGVVRAPILEESQTDRMLPPSERGVMRWDKNPWSAVQGDGGGTESSGVYWLLPYWMGRYCGFIG